MKKLFSVLIIVTALLTSTISYAVQAYPGLIKFKQPDGTLINIFLKGDEFHRWAITEDGYTLLHNADGAYEYAMQDASGDLQPSGILARDIAQRDMTSKIFLNNLSKELFFSPSQIQIIQQIKNIRRQEQMNTKAFPTTGSRKLICILIGYTNLAFTKTQAEFNNLFNQVGYSTGGATGSVKDYYLENSYNQFNLTVDVAGPYTASNTMAYYGGNLSGNDRRPRELVAEAINLADPAVNYALYDNDGDNWVDGVYIIYAGYGEEAGASTDAIWAHAWSLSSAVQKDGVYLQRYSCSAELRGSSGTSITNIGVICHEFGHVLGAPDYYDTDYTTGGQYQGTGSWDMMAGGSWNNDGATPAHHNGFTKVIYYNWATVNLLSSASTITLKNAAEFSDSFYRFYTATSGEYYFIENREKHKFDAHIPGSGMVIYHVHSTVLTAGNSNNINNTHPQKMYPVSQNATSDPTSTSASYGTINSATCAWTGLGGTKTSFADYTLPSSKSWLGANTAKPITNIFRSAASKKVTFDFMGGAPNAPLNFTATSMGASQINLSWQLNALGNDVLIAYTSDDNFGTPVDGVVYTSGQSIPGGGTVIYKGNATAFSHTNLTEKSNYFYKAWSVLSGNTYSFGKTADARTLCYPSTVFPNTQDFNASTNCPDCWSIKDNQGNGQVWQFGTVTGGLTGSTGNYAYLNSDAYGSGNTQNTDLISPTFDFSGYTSVNLTFKHYFRRYSTGETATLSYSLNNGSTWTQIQQWTNASTTNPATFNQTIGALANQPLVKFKWNYTATWAFSWSIDDITVTATPSSSLTVTGTTHTVSANRAYSNVTVKSNGNLTINADKILTVTGNFVIESDAGGTGSFVQNGLLRVSGNTTTQKYLPNTAPYGWNISVPVKQANETVLSGANAVYYYNPLAAAWQLYTTGSLQQMTGYVVRFPSTTTLNFQGSLNNGTNIKNDFVRSTSPNNFGWNYAGNPFPSPIDWNLVTKTNINSAVYYRKTDGALAAYVAGIGTNGGTNIIPAMQAFWVQVPQGQSTGSLQIPNSARTHGLNNNYKAESQTFIRLTLSNNDNTDEALIRFMPDAHPHFDNAYDASKMFTENPEIPQIYTITDEDNLCINTLPPTTPLALLGLTTFNGGAHTLSLSEISGSVQVTLEDMETNTFTLLNDNPAYTFNAASGQNNERFRLHFATPTAMSDYSADESVQAYAYGNALYVHYTGNASAQLTLYALHGAAIMQTTIQPNTINKLPTRVSAGCYIVTVNTGLGVVSKKVFVQ